MDSDWKSFVGFASFYAFSVRLCSTIFLVLGTRKRHIDIPERILGILELNLTTLLLGDVGWWN
ncbi:hypothetical protein B0H34DRAFT_691952 [Crassisporium funariophilum]|nr:hypothetical protein B0H34DRAFT_691952 [Crassisporium funariophilum]